MPLIVAGNRDEFHARPTQDAHWWPDEPDVLGGRDLQAGGTWLGLHRNGRFATVTNFRDAVAPVGNLASRGHLTTKFLTSDISPIDYVADIQGQHYGGFNLLVSDGEQMAYLSNRNSNCQELPPGIYGLANAALDTPWPKIMRSKTALRALLDANNINQTSLLRLLNDRDKARVGEVQPEGLPFDKAHALTAPFIVLPDYGTRCSTTIIRNRQNTISMTEKRFAASGTSTGQSDFRFVVSDQSS